MPSPASGGPLGRARAGLPVVDLLPARGYRARARNRINQPGFYLMDEPDAPLSFVASLGLVALLHDISEAGGQIIVATHSPVVAAVPGATSCGTQASSGGTCRRVSRRPDYSQAPRQDIAYGGRCEDVPSTRDSACSTSSARPSAAPSPAAPPGSASSLAALGARTGWPAQPQSRHSASPSRRTRCTLAHTEHRSRSEAQSKAPWQPGQIST